MSGFGIFLSSLISSAVSTIVNHGTFASFAIGMGIGIAAGVVASGVGGYFGGGAKAWSNFAKGGLIGMAMSAALIGATAGAITSAVYGQNIGKGMLNGMQAGLMGFAVGAIASVAIAFGKSVIEDMFPAQHVSDPAYGGADWGPKKGDVVSEVIGKAVLPWRINPEGYENWQFWDTYIEPLWTLSGIEVAVHPAAAFDWIIDQAHGSLASKAGNEWIKLLSKGEGYRGHLKIQDYIYKRTLFNWKLHWVDLSKPHYVEVTGGRGWYPELNFGCYKNSCYAAIAVRREAESKKYDGRW